MGLSLCYWSWDGIEWQEVRNTCPDECGCDPPVGQPGSFIGDMKTTPCSCP